MRQYYDLQFWDIETETRWFTQSSRRKVTNPGLESMPWDSTSCLLFHCNSCENVGWTNLQRPLNFKLRIWSKLYDYKQPKNMESRRVKVIQGQVYNGCGWVCWNPPSKRQWDWSWEGTVGLEGMISTHWNLLSFCLPAFSCIKCTKGTLSTRQYPGYFVYIILLNPSHNPVR